MISTSGITFSYSKDQLFHMPDLYCEAGSTILITGDSGKGKTTYLHILAGILKPNKGEILIGKKDIVSLSDAKRDKFRGKNIGLVLQKSHFVAAFTVLENLEMASWLATGKKNTSRAKELLEKLDIANQANKFIKQTMNDSKTETDSSHVNLYNTRKMSKTRDIYPINNHDFDYKTAMIKNHNIYKLGFTNQPTYCRLISKS